MKKSKNIMKALTLVSQIGISMLVPIALSMFIGGTLDKYLKTGPIFLFIFIVIGVSAAFRNLFALTKKFTKKDKDQDDF